MPKTVDYSHKTQPVTGILLTNLGTPDAPTTEALRRYLKEFLWDPRIVDLPRPLWWMILQVILLLRPKRSAQAYQAVWTEEGSPLLSISKSQVEAVAAFFRGEGIEADSVEEESREGKNPFPVKVALGMRYGNPSIAHGLQQLRDANAHRILVMPLYPQYSSSTTASTFDAIAKEVKTWRWLPEFRFINNYHDEHDYITALANSITEAWQGRSKPQKLLFSFHGTPKRFLITGDPYYCQCHKTARLVADRLELKQDEWMITFQSIFGREEWLKPYTIETLSGFPEQGIKNVDVVCPGFSADCLETLEEIQVENRDAFKQAGGEQYHYIPALNDRPDHIAMMVRLIRQHTQGWINGSQKIEDVFDTQSHEKHSAQRQQRAMAKGAAK